MFSEISPIQLTRVPWISKANLGPNALGMREGGPGLGGWGCGTKLDRRPGGQQGDTEAQLGLQFPEECWGPAWWGLDVPADPLLQSGVT